MLFIVSSNAEKADPATRRLIRSEVLRGTKQKRKPSLRAAKAKDQRKTTRSSSLAPIKLEHAVELCAQLLPNRIGSDLSFIQLADEVELSVLKNITEFSSLAMKVIYPLVVAIGFPVDTRDFLCAVVSDAAALHVTAFAVQWFFDRILRHRENYCSPASILNLQKGLKILRERLLVGDEESKTSDSTISVVLKLASAAHFHGDDSTSQQHMEGLRKMVRLRGGLHVFQGNKLFLEMLRCDLSIALLNETNTVFFCQPSEPIISYPADLLLNFDPKTSSEDSMALFRVMDNDLALAWQAMKRFCWVVNLGTQTHKLIDPKLIHETMAAVVYRLLHMNFAARSTDEAVRLGLLAFAHHIFLQWQDIKPLHSNFHSAFRKCILDVKHVDNVSPQLILWLLMTGANSLFDISTEAWLKEYLLEYIIKCHVKTWKEMHEVLKSFMWIALLDEQSGKKIYDLLGLYLEMD